MKLTILRKERGLTQSDLASMCGTTQQQIAKIEGGIVDPKLSTLRKIAESLEIELADLFFSKREFLCSLNEVVKEEGLSSKRIGLAYLNSLAFEIKKIPRFHPFWEKVVLRKSKVIFKEENND